MFIFDQLKRNEPELQLISVSVLVGFSILLSGLWYLQIVSGEKFEENQKNQSIRSVRVPAIRGKILDRNGEVLAENRPRYIVQVYLEELLSDFHKEYTNRVYKEYVQQHPELRQAAPAVKWSSRMRNWVRGLIGKQSSTTTVRLPSSTTDDLKREASYRVVSNMTYRISSAVKSPQTLDRKTFLKHYLESRYVPYPIIRNLTLNQVAVFQERLGDMPSVELEIQPVRSYPHGDTAAHVLGYVRPEQIEDEEIPYRYNSPDFVGKSGVEGIFDAELRGKAGVKNVVVNSSCFRQREDVMNSIPGQNIFLTIDLEIQKAAEEALSKAMENARGAAVVLDVRNGDILAMASAPAFDPNEWVDQISHARWERLSDKELTPMFNRATHPYPPGSTFKIITAIACLENGVNPKEHLHCPGAYDPPRGHRINDTAGVGDFDFDEAFYRSSNYYFIYHGLRAGLPRILEVGKRFHLGEPTELSIRHEDGGYFPTPDELGGIFAQPTAPNVCIGQEITTTPLQMALVTAAVANGGKLFWPRIVTHLQSPEDKAEEELFAPGRIRSVIRANPRHLEVIRHAMLLDTVNPRGTGHAAFNKKGLPPEFQVGGKTGTAEVKSAGKKHYVTWFVSYGPWTDPRYAVVVMVEHGNSGGGTCAPVAQQIYQTIVKREQSAPKLAFN